MTAKAWQINNKRGKGMLFLPILQFMHFKINSLGTIWFMAKHVATNKTPSVTNRYQWQLHFVGFCSLSHFNSIWSSSRRQKSAATHTHTLAHVASLWPMTFHYTRRSMFGWQRGSRPLECSPFIIMSSLLDSRDKWETSKEDTNSEMHYCLSGGCAQPPLSLPSLRLDGCSKIPGLH